MKYFICLLLFATGVGTHHKLAAQNENTHNRFSQWSIRLNPLSFIERFGGVDLGFETNIDKKRRWALVSEYGYLFINNSASAGNSRTNKKNNNPLSGFKTKQEVRWILPKNEGTRAIGLELTHRQARIANEGWFGMGTPNARRLYPFFKYHNFTEEVIETSMAFKYIFKTAPKKGRLGAEGFVGLGVLNRDINYTKTEGTLVQPEAATLMDKDRATMLPYLSLGFRVFFTVAE